MQKSIKNDIVVRRVSDVLQKKNKLNFFKSLA